MPIRACLVALLLSVPALAQSPTDLDLAAGRTPSVYPPAAVGPTDSAWGYDARYAAAEDRRFVTFRLDGGAAPADGPAVQSPDGSLVQGCDFDDLDLTQLVCISASGALFSVDLTTEVVSLIGQGSYGGGVADLTYSVADDAWYALVSSCDGPSEEHRTRLARVDPVSGTATAVGTGTQGSFCGLGLAATADGILYTYSAETPVAFSRTATIDPVTGAFTTLGATGLDAFYAQSMDCDASDGQCYAFGYVGSGVNGLYLVSAETGAFANAGELPEGAQISAGAIATTTAMITGVDAPLRDAPALRVLSATPTQGTVRLGIGDAGTLDVFDALGRRVQRLTVSPGTMSIDASRWSPGVYTVQLVAGHAVSNVRIVVSRK